MAKAEPSEKTSVLFCAECIHFQKGACAIGKVSPGEDITTVSDCGHREFPPVDPTPILPGKTPAQE